MDSSDLCRANIMATLAAMPEMTAKRFVDVARAAKASGLKEDAARRSSVYCARRASVRSSFKGNEIRDVIKDTEDAIRSALEVDDLDGVSEGQIANLVTRACVIKELESCDLGTWFLFTHSVSLICITHSKFTGTLPPAKIVAQVVKNVSKESIVRLESITSSAVESVVTWLVASNSLSVREAESYAKDMIKSMGLDENKYAAHVEQHVADHMSSTMSTPGTAASKAALIAMNSAVGTTKMSQGRTTNNITVSSGPPSFDTTSSTTMMTTTTSDDGRSTSCLE